MKLLCILISFAMVNVLVAYIDRYKKEVIITNQYIELEKDRLPEIIRKIISWRNINRYYRMEDMSFMVAVPEATDAEGYSNVTAQSDMKRDIIMATTENISFMEAVQIIKVPEINEDSFENVSLEELGDARRALTLEAITTLTLSVIDNKEDPFFKEFGQENLCYLIGLFRSAKYPSSFIVDAEYQNIENSKNSFICLLTTKSSLKIRYEYINDNIVEVQRLYDQLQ